MSLKTLVASCVIGAILSTVASTALAFKHREAETIQDSREFFVDENKLPFDPIPGIPSQRHWGVDAGAGYRIEIPDAWNGDLVVYTHGFRGEGEELTVDSPPLRAYYLARGYAWLASSYSANFYDVRSGVESTNSLVRHFIKNYGKPTRTYITGFSMGGHVIGAAIEQFPNVACPEGRRGRFCKRITKLLGKLSGGVKYDGAAPHCGVMGDEELFHYFGNFSLAAEALADVQSEFPAPEDYFDRIFLPTIFGLYENPLDLLGSNGSAAIPNAQGDKLRAFTTQITGGDRPLADFAFPFFQQLLFGFSGGDGTVTGILSGSVLDNRRDIFQLDGDPDLSADELALNQSILRVKRDRNVNPKQFLRVSRVPIITGRIDIPVISIHTTGDLFVPFSMEQIYAREAKKQRRSHNLVSRATRAVGHCEFSQEELVETFDDLVTWVEDGVRPKGDDILDPENVAAPLFGCGFSRGSTATRQFAPCPE
ncbi:MAG: hypothetical protein K6L75_01155 [Cellvibrionaceae bacterium]